MSNNQNAHSGKRIIQPPGGSSNIFMGGDEAPQKAHVNTRGGGQFQNDQSKSNVFAGEDYQEAKQEKKQPEEVESQPNSGGNSNTSGSASSEANRNKDRMKSSIAFGESTNESAAQNKSQRGERGYNLISGQTNSEEKASKKKDQDDSVKEAEAHKVSNQKEFDAPAAGMNKPSTKVREPPGGRSSGPLW